MELQEREGRKGKTGTSTFSVTAYSAIGTMAEEEVITGVLATWQIGQSLEL